MEPFEIIWMGSVNGSQSGVSLGQYQINNLESGNYQVSVTDANGCSVSCGFTIDNVVCDIFEAVVSNVLCDDNGTSSDPSDDTFTFELIVNGTNVSTDGYQITSPFIFFGNYGQIVTLGPLNISDGDILIELEDIDYQDCNINIQVEVPSTCSNDCELVANIIDISDCDDGGTGNTEDDDTFDVTIYVSGQNTGSTYSVIIGGDTYGPFNYNENVVIDNLPADNSMIQLNIMDVNDTSCSTMLSVSLAPCSSCNQSVDAGENMIITCDNDSVQLKGSASEPGGTFVWVTPDNVTIQGQNPNVDIPGWYYLEVTFEDQCVAIDSVLVDVDSSVPVADAGPDLVINCLINEVTLGGTNTSVGDDYEYIWRDQSGNIISTDLHPTVSEGGIYTLEVINITNNCTSPLSTVIVDSNTDLPSVVIYASPDNVIDCVVGLVTLSTDEIPNVDYTWVYQNVQLNQNEITVEEGGIVQLIAIDTLTGCQNQNQIEIIELIEYPIITIEAPEPIDCQLSTITIDAGASQTGSTITYQWYDSNNNPIPNANGLTLDVNQEGTYYLESIDSNNGCTNIDTVIVENIISYPSIDAGDETTIDCNDNEATLNASIIGVTDSNSSWYDAFGNIVGNVNEIVVESPGVYYLSVTNNENHCMSQDSVVVLPADYPQFVYDYEHEGCGSTPEGLISITSISGGTEPYQSALNNGTLTAQMLYSGLQGGVYSIVVVDANGCSSEEQVTLQEGVPFELSIDGIDKIDLGDKTLLSAIVGVPESQIDTAFWSPLDSLDCFDINCLSAEVGPSFSTQYSLTVIDIYGCEAIAFINIFVDRNILITAPNIFSPNGDGVNDYFGIYVDKPELIDVYDLYIFDRWGALVYNESLVDVNNRYNGWDGKFKGRNVEQGVYTFMVKFKIRGGQEEVFTGDITVMR